MFQRMPEAGRRPLRFTLDGAPAEGFEGDTVAAALLASGHTTCRETAVSGTPRGSYCLMGVCFDCLVTIDGTGNRQGCLVRLEDGMRVETQHGKREVGR
ncbi:(2Fe-2S)-binding protein [Roseicella aquatilis]|uniref:(2Fe-2S)-binding protein n=2 Tax=Roseicella aquatilis TaxID=2527868 RepID=A0A4R4D3V6_9PROT|nr:(2Fe-2S)-binding protein [Roseicella aquatilis]